MGSKQDWNTSDEHQILLSHVWHLALMFQSLWSAVGLGRFDLVAHIASLLNWLSYLRAALSYILVQGLWYYSISIRPQLQLSLRHPDLAVHCLASVTLWTMLKGFLTCSVCIFMTENPALLGCCFQVLLVRDRNWSFWSTVVGIPILILGST